jgi:hypothetical protein
MKEWNVDFGKMGLLLCILVATVLLSIFHLIDATLVQLVLTTELGYIIGNGINASKGVQSKGVFDNPTNVQQSPTEVTKTIVHQETTTKKDL